MHGKNEPLEIIERKRKKERENKEFKDQLRDSPLIYEAILVNDIWIKCNWG